ncbi:unnamed protein product [Polarella glacialis]|uniref:Uncharacterized protein n=1 Tax=Polarella glacialis TaxID=89957 RepID=A0A813IA75_POLGL|nr:unnamed protein product [Polarella glacialis]
MNGSQYSGTEFADIQRSNVSGIEKGPKDVKVALNKDQGNKDEGRGGALAVLCLTLLAYGGASPKPFLTLTDKAPWAWEVVVLGYMLKCAHDVREQVEGFYWAKSLVVTGIAAFGGGFLAPAIVGHCPPPLREETFFWACVFSWYVTHYVPYVSASWKDLSRTRAMQLLLTVLFGIFKTQQIVGLIELSAKAIAEENLIPQSRYFSQPCAAPLLCGFLGGCGGAFLPLSKGLLPIEQGKQWPVSAAFLATVFYYVSTRYLGVDALNAKLGVCLFRILGDIFPAQRVQIYEAASPVLYRLSNLKRVAKETAKSMV